MKKKIIVPALLACLAVGGTITVTYAYLTDQDRADNEISVTENEIHIEEEFEPPDDPKPGSVITKSPVIVNDSAVSVYVRMSAKFSNSAAEGFCIPPEIHDRWQKNTDGYYYYDTALSPGEKTVPLFEKIIIRDDVSQEELTPFDVLVYAESVQAYELSREAAWSLFAGGYADGKATDAEDNNIQIPVLQTKETEAEKEGIL